VELDSKTEKDSSLSPVRGTLTINEQASVRGVDVLTSNNCIFEPVFKAIYSSPTLRSSRSEFSHNNRLMIIIYSNNTLFLRNCVLQHAVHYKSYIFLSISCQLSAFPRINILERTKLRKITLKKQIIQQQIRYTILSGNLWVW